MGEGKRIFDGSHIRATAFEVNGARRLVALFGHLRPKQGFPDATPSQYFVAQGISQIRIQVSANDFYLNDDLPAARVALYEYTRTFGAVTGMGFSMGGFGCLVLARALNLKKALLISPLRQVFDRARIAEPLDLTAEAAIFSCPGGRHSGVHAPLRGNILFDPWVSQGHDQAYARVLATLFPGLRAVAIPGGGHPATSQLVRMDRFASLQAAFGRSDFTAGDFRDLHRETRGHCPEYRRKIAQRLAEVEPVLGNLDFATLRGTPGSASFQPLLGGH